jgi:DNA modification methylase
VAPQQPHPEPVCEQDSQARQAQLTGAEVRRLQRLEGEIRQGLQGSFKVAHALREINEKRLYRATHATFATYVRERFGIETSQAYNLLNADKVMSALSSGVDKTALPECPRHAADLRPLLEQGEEALQTFWQGLRARYPQGLTTATVAQAVRERRAASAPRIKPLPKRAGSKAGTVYQLGEHRLLCGDATDTDLLEEFLRGVRAQVIWTDPPYGVSYQEDDPTRALANDNPDQILDLLSRAFSAISPALAENAPFYICSPDGPQKLEFLLALKRVGWRLHQTLIWDKTSTVLSRCDYHFEHEPILYGWAQGTGNPRRLARKNECRWFGGNNASTVIRVARPRQSAEHPTMKPPELIEQLLRNSTQEGDVVLDPFAGSGSTLEACHHLGLTAYLIELEPAYCDVIRNRWAKLEKAAEEGRSGAGR